MRKIVVLVVLSFFTFSLVQAGVRIVKEKEKFYTLGSIEVVAEKDFSIDQFKSENKRKGVYSHFNRKITDEGFGVELKYQKVEMYLVRSKDNLPFTMAEAVNYIEQQNGIRPTLAWTLLAMKQYKEDLFMQNTVIFTEESIAGKKGYNLIPFITSENGIHLYYREFPNENCDFIYIVPVEDEKLSNIQE